SNPGNDLLIVFLALIGPFLTFESSVFSVAELFCSSNKTFLNSILCTVKNAKIIKIPGNKAPKNKSFTETPTVAPYKIRGIEGGMSTPNKPDPAIRDAT